MIKAAIEKSLGAPKEIVIYVLTEAERQVFGRMIQESSYPGSKNIYVRVFYPKRDAQFLKNMDDCVFIDHGIYEKYCSDILEGFHRFDSRITVG